MKQVNKTTLAEVRQQAAKCVKGLLNKGVSPMQADAIYKQNLTIVDSYRVELRAIETAHAMSKDAIDYKQALELIAK